MPGKVKGNPQRCQLYDSAGVHRALPPYSVPITNASRLYIIYYNIVYHKFAFTYLNNIMTSHVLYRCGNLTSPTLVL